MVLNCHNSCRKNGIFRVFEVEDHDFGNRVGLLVTKYSTYIRLPLFYYSIAGFNAAKRSKPQTWFRFVPLIKVNRTTADGFIIGSSVQC